MFCRKGDISQNGFCDFFDLLGSVFGRTDLSRIFIFGPPDFFADFVAGFFLLIFVGKKCPEKSSRKIPAKILQNLYNKNPPTHFCRLGGATLYQVPAHVKVLPDLHLKDDIDVRTRNVLRTAILLHDNLLSCYVPGYGDVPAPVS